MGIGMIDNRWITIMDFLKDDCDCWCAIKLSHFVYDYKSHELLRNSSEIFEDFVEFKDGEFVFPEPYCNALALGSTSFETWFCSEENAPVLFKRDNAYKWSAKWLEHGNKKVKWERMCMAEVEILAYYVMPSDYEE